MSRYGIDEVAQWDFELWNGTYVGPFLFDPMLIRSVRTAANCIITDHFSAFKSGLVAPFLYAA